jgi:hypothetical protein
MSKYYRIEKLPLDWDTESQIADLTYKINELIRVVNTILAALPESEQS